MQKLASCVLASLLALCAVLFFDTTAPALEMNITHPDDPSKTVVSIHVYDIWDCIGDEDWLVIKESEGAAESFYVRLEHYQAIEPREVARDLADGAKFRNFMKYDEAFLWNDKDSTHLLVAPKGHDVCVVFSWDKGYKVGANGVPSLVDEMVHKSTIAGKPLLK